MKVNIAVVQFRIQPLTPLYNLNRAEQFIRSAADKGADIIAFPEDFLTGPSIARNKNVIDYTGKYIHTFRLLAQKYGIDIVPGSIAEGESSGRLYNVTYYIDRSGDICGRYCKINLWHSERAYITPGTEIITCDTRFGRVGLTICWDLIYPELFRTMVQQKAEIVFCPSFWCIEDAGVGVNYNVRSEITLVNSLCSARAFENEIALVYINAARRPKPLLRPNYVFGRSQITLPFYGAIKRIDHPYEHMFIQHVDLSLLKVAEQIYTIHQDLQVYRKEHSIV